MKTAIGKSDDPLTLAAKNAADHLQLEKDELVKALCRLQPAKAGSIANFKNEEKEWYERASLLETGKSDGDKIYKSTDKSCDIKANDGIYEKIENTKGYSKTLSTE